MSTWAHQTSIRKVNIIGAGGHARVIAATARAAGWRINAFFDDDRDKWGTHQLGLEIRGPTASALQDNGTVAVLGIGSNRVRARMASEAACPWAVIIHPSAVVNTTFTRVGQGTVIFAGCVVQPGCDIGDHVVINTGASIDHDCAIGDYAFVGPGARMCGHVVLGDGVMVGAGAVAIPERTVGPWATVGALAAVVHDIPERVVAVGVPARPCAPSTGPGARR